MLLTAYYKGLASLLTGGIGESAMKYDGTSFNIINPTDVCIRYAVGLGRLENLLTAYANTSGVIFGTGSTPPALDDYRLSGDVVSTLLVLATKKVEKVDGGAVISMLYTLTNTGDTDVTISEVGYLGSLTNKTNVSYAVLLERTVLDSPVTIPAGGVGQVTYTIRLNYPTA